MCRHMKLTIFLEMLHNLPHLDKRFVLQESPSRAGPGQRQLHRAPPAGEREPNPKHYISVFFFFLTV